MTASFPESSRRQCPVREGTGREGTGRGEMVRGEMVDVASFAMRGCVGGALAGTLRHPHPSGPGGYVSSWTQMPRSSPSPASECEF